MTVLFMIRYNKQITITHTVVLQVILAQDAMQFIFQIKVYWQLNCHIKYLPFRVKNYLN